LFNPMDNGPDGLCADIGPLEWILVLWVMLNYLKICF
jgi:hypothetical protein